MVESLDTIPLDSIKTKYLHIAYYIPKKSTKSGGVMKTWIKDSPKGAAWYNTNHYPGKGYTPETMKWVDAVFDVFELTDTIHGKPVTHCEFYGFAIGDTSYVGKIELTDSPEPRFVNKIKATSITVSLDMTEVKEGETAKASAVVLPANNEEAVMWKLLGATEGTTIDENGVVTAGAAGMVKVVGMAGAVSDTAELTIVKSEMVIVDFSKANITYSSQDSLKSAGDVWIRDNTGDLTTIKVVSTGMAPEGYNLTDSVLQVVVDPAFSKYFDGLMVECDTIALDTLETKYLHIAYYIPKKSTKNAGVMKTWIKESPKGAAWYNTNHYPNKGFDPKTMKWVDAVFNVFELTDTLQGKPVTHCEFYGFAIGDTSYVGSIVLSDSPEPRFDNSVYVTEITLATSILGDSVLQGQNITISAMAMPEGADNKAVTWEVIDPTVGTSISAAGVLTAGEPGKVTVKATAQDGSGVSATIEVKIYTNTAVKDYYASSLHVYPNPSEGKFYISLDGNSAIFRVMDNSGRVISTGTIDRSMTLDLSSQKTGIYLLEVISNGERTINKLMIK